MANEEKLYGGPLLKAIDIMDFLRDQQVPQSTKDICAGTELTKGTASKLLATMQTLNLVSRDLETQKYVIGNRLIGYGQSAIDHYSFKELVLPLMTELHEALGETVHLGIRAGAYMMYLNKLEAKNPISLRSKIGGQAPIYTSAMGKAYMAEEPAYIVERYATETEFTAYTEHTILENEDFKKEIEEVKARGYSRDNEEFERGVTSYAVSLTSRSHNYGAISVSVPVYRLTPELKEQIISELLVIKEKAAQILN